MKCRRIITALTALMLAMPMAVMAVDNKKTERTSDAIVISMDTIENIMLQYSTDMKQIKANLTTAQKNYSKMLYDMDDLKDEIHAADLTTGLGLTASYEKMEDARDQLKTALDVAQATYEQKVQQQVLMVQRQFLAYYAGVTAQRAAEEQVRQQTVAVSDNQGKLEHGFLSQKEYNNAVVSLKKAQSQAKAAKTASEASLRGLKAKLGIPDDSRTELVEPDLHSMDFSFLTKLDFQSDLAKALEKSSAIRAAQLTYDNAYKGDYAEDWDIESYKISIDLTKQQVRDGFQQMYDGLQTGYEALMADRAALEKQRSDLSDEQEKVKNGFSTQKWADGLKLQLSAAESSVTLEENDLYSAYLNYLLMRAGN